MQISNIKDRPPLGFSNARLSALVQRQHPSVLWPGLTQRRKVSEKVTGKVTGKVLALLLTKKKKE